MTEQSLLGKSVNSAQITIAALYLVQRRNQKGSQEVSVIEYTRISTSQLSEAMNSVGLVGHNYNATTHISRYRRAKLVHYSTSVDDIENIINNFRESKT